MGQKVEGAGLIQKALDFLFKGLDKLMEEAVAESKRNVNIKETKPAKKEGKIGKTYKFAIEDTDGGVFVDVWPIQGRKNLFYVDRMEPYGVDYDGNKIKFDREFKPKTVPDKDIVKLVLQALDDAGIVVTKDSVRREESSKRAKSASKAWEKTNSESNYYDKSDESAINKAVDEAFGLNNESDTSSSYKFRAKLMKVSASNTVDLVSIDYKDANSSDVWDKLCEISENAQFVDSLEDDEPVCIEVNNDNNVNIIDDMEIDLGDVAKSLYKYVINAKNTLITIESACRDPQFKSMYGSIVWIIEDLVSVATSLVIKWADIYPNPGLVETSGSDLTEALDLVSGLTLMRDVISGIVDELSMRIMAPFPEIDNFGLMENCDKLEKFKIRDLDPYIESLT